MKDIETGQYAGPQLTAEGALERAKDYVKAARGSLPDDLLPISVSFCAPPDEWERQRNPLWMRRFRDQPGLWTVTFQRYAGSFPYSDELATIHFSERYGVWLYRDEYYSRVWRGRVRTTPQEAVQVTRKPADEWFEEYAAGYEDSRSLILRRPPYLKDGRPVLMNIVEGRPRAVHAVWIVAYPYSVTRVHTPDGVEVLESHFEFLVDAETGRIISREHDVPN